jgi:hypothetical protein
MGFRDTMVVANWLGGRLNANASHSHLDTLVGMILAYARSVPIDSAVNENHSHLDTLAGARVSDLKPRVYTYIYLLTRFRG